MKKKKIITNIKKDTKGKAAALTLEGELGLNHALLLQQKIQVLINDYDQLTIKIKNVQNFDLSSLQLLYAVYSTSLRLNKVLTVEINLPEELKMIMDHAGFNPVMKLLAPKN